MNEAKHTPGPWKAVFGKNAALAIGPKILADLYFTELPDGEEEANAYLMAAAPDLLEACKEYLHATTDALVSHTQEEAAEERLREAIAKAEGKE